MVYLEKYNKDKQYYFQNGSIANYEILKDLYNAIDMKPFVVFTDYTGEIIISFEMLDLVRTKHDINPALSEDEAVEELRTKLNETESEDIDALDRIASALEFQALMSLPDEEV